MIWIIILLASVLRFVNLNQSLWWDEGITAWIVKNTNTWQLLTVFMKSDFHPPFHYLLLQVWGNIFGFGEIYLRLPSVILALANVYLVYLIGKDLFSRRIGILGSAFLAVAPLHIYYSQEARMYSLAAFAVTLSWYFFIRLINKQKFAWVLYSLSVVLVFYSDYTAVFSIIAQAICLIIFYRGYIKEFLKAGIVSMVMILPWLPMFAEQLGFGIFSTNDLPRWKMTIGGSSVKDLLLLPIKVLVGRISFDNKLLYALMVGVVGLINAVLVGSAVKSRDKKVAMLLLWLIVSPLLAFILSVKIPIFSYFRLIFILPAFYLLLAVGVDKFKNLFFKILLILILLLEVTFSLIYLLDAKFHREDWRGAVSFVNQNKSPGMVTLHKNIMIPLVVRYYQSSDINSKSAFKRLPISKTTDLNDLDINLLNFKKILLFDYLTDITDLNRILEKELNKLGYKILIIDDFRGVGVITTYVK